MKSKMMVVGFALASVLAVAQSSNMDQKKTSTDPKQTTNTSADKTKDSSAKPDAAASTTTAREASSGMATGKRAAEAPKPDPKSEKVATGDVTGDQKSATGTQEVKAPRDAATGQASGKRQHK